MNDLSAPGRSIPSGLGPVLAGPRRLSALGAAMVAALATLAAWPCASAPTLWGYGVKSCADVVAAVPRAGATPPALGEEYLRYREWLAGLVTGLNLATGSDVLAGAELEAAMTRIRAHCADHPKDDFFNAALALFKSLGRPEGTKP